MPTPTNGWTGCSIDCPQPDGDRPRETFQVAWHAGPTGAVAQPILPTESLIVNRRLRGIVPASLAIVLLTLSACGSNDSGANATASPAPTAAPTATAAPTPAPITPANNLDAITVEGAAGQKPTINVPAPWAIDETRSKVLIAGNGATVGENSTVEVHYVGVNGRTGQVFDDSWSRGAPVAFPLDQVVPGFRKGLANQKVGSRVLVAMPGSDGYDASGGNPQVGIEVGDTLVFAVDILSTPLPTAEGDPVQPAAGLPTVTMEGNKPKVTIPANTPAPTQLVVQPLIKGHGKPVQPTDTITAVYQTVLWSNGSVIEDTYGKEPETASLSSLVPAWQEGLKDQPVGSRVMIIAPPDKAYPEDPGATSPNPARGQTVVYVIDVLYATASQ